MALTATVYHVDLTHGRIETKTIPEDVYRRYPGGSALAAYLLLQNTRAGADPHSHPRNTPSARDQKSEFLKIDGKVVDVCAGKPCYANGYTGAP